jgi:hypothetical protein
MGTCPVLCVGSKHVHKIPILQGTDSFLLRHMVDGFGQRNVRINAVSAVNSLLLGEG